MPDITRVTGPWTDNNPLAAEDLLKDVFHYGRLAGFDGTRGGFEIINGQLDFDGNFDGTETITSRYVRRGAFTTGPYVAGWRQSRDFWYKNFPDLIPQKTPDIYEEARPVLGCTWENKGTILDTVDSVLIDITMDYTVASDQDFQEDGTAPDPTLENPPFLAFIGVWINDVFYEPSATPVVAGRSSTVRPYRKSDRQYNNVGYAPDFRTFSMKLRVTAEEVVVYPGLSGFLSGGWRNVSVRVSGRQTIRVHGGAVIVTPIR
jgi:hypothetical protein